MTYLIDALVTSKHRTEPCASRWVWEDFISFYQNSIFEETYKMTTTTIRKKLAAWVKVADAQKIKAVYTMVADEIETAENEWEEDFVNELKQRSKAMADGTAKTYTWAETKGAVGEMNDIKAGKKKDLKAEDF